MKYEDWLQEHGFDDYEKCTHPFNFLDFDFCRNFMRVECPCGFFETYTLPKISCPGCNSSRGKKFYILEVTAGKVEKSEFRFLCCCENCNINFETLNLKIYASKTKN